MKIKFTKHSKCQLILDSLVKENIIDKTLETPMGFVPSHVDELKDYTYFLTYIENEISGVVWITPDLHIHWSTYKKFYGTGKVMAEVFLNHILPSDKDYSGKTLIASTIPKASHARKILRDLGFQPDVNNSHAFYIKVQ